MFKDENDEQSARMRKALGNQMVAEEPRNLFHEYKKVSSRSSTVDANSMHVMSAAVSPLVKNFNPSNFQKNMQSHPINVPTVLTSQQSSPFASV